MYCTCGCGYRVAGLNVWSMGHKVYSGRSVVKHGSYQLSLSEGLAESHRSAMHQYTALFSHFTVAALRPVRRAEWVITTAKGITREHRRCSDFTLWLQEESWTFSPTRCSGPALLGGWSQSRHAAQRACRGVPLHKHKHHMLTVRHNLYNTLSSHVLITCVIIISNEKGKNSA